MKRCRMPAAVFSASNFLDHHGAGKNHRARAVPRWCKAADKLAFSKAAGSYFQIRLAGSAGRVLLTSTLPRFLACTLPRFYKNS